MLNSFERRSVAAFIIKSPDRVMLEKGQLMKLMREIKVTDAASESSDDQSDNALVVRESTAAALNDADQRVISRLVCEREAEREEQENQARIRKAENSPWYR